MANRRTIIQLSPPKTPSNSPPPSNRNSFQIRAPANYAQRTENVIQSYLISDGDTQRRATQPSYSPSYAQPLRLSGNNPNPALSSSESRLREDINNINTSNDPELKLSGLLSIINYSGNPSYQSMMISLGVVNHLVNIINLEDEVCSSYAILSLSNLSLSSDQNKRLIGSSGVIYKLKDILSHSSSVNILTNTIMLLTNLTCSEEIVEEIARMLIISNIADTLEFVPDKLFHSSLLMIQNTLHSPTVKAALIDQGELKKILNGVNRFIENAEIVNDTSIILSTISYEEHISTKLIDLGVLPLLIQQLKQIDTETLRHSLATLTNLSADQINIKKISESGVIERVIELLDHENFEVVEHAIMTLSNLSTDSAQGNYIAEIAIEQIGNTFEHFNENLQIRTAKLISILSQYDMPRYKINQSQIFKSLKQREKSSNNNLSYYCSLALKRLVQPTKYFPQFKHADSSISPDKAEKFRCHRINVIQEILDTERTYTAHLIAVNQFFMKPLRDLADSGKPLITDMQFKDIFGGLDILCTMHTNFLQNIEKVIALSKENYQQNNQLNTENLAQNENGDIFGEVAIGDVFIELVNCLKLYRNYISNYDKAVDTLSTALENKKFKQFVQDQQTTYHTLGISSILITPIQRIPRYSLLLQDLIKHMTEDHPDFKKVNEALKGVLVVADYLEEEKGKTEAMNKVISIQEKIDNLPMKLVEPHRFYVKEGDLVSEPNTKSSDLFYCYFFLFCDLVVVCKQHGSKYRFKKLFHLQSIKVVPLPDDSKPNSFRILTQDDGVTYTANSKAERDAWVTSFHSYIFEEKKNSVQRRVASQKLV